MMLNPYQILDIPRSATPEEIKNAYFKLIKKYPPEHEPEKFKTIRQAYESLKTSAKKAETDVFIFKDTEQSFEIPDEMRQSYDVEIKAEDMIEILKELYTDLHKIDFADDYTSVL